MIDDTVKMMTIIIKFISAASSTSSYRNKTYSKLECQWQLVVTTVTMTTRLAGTQTMIVAAADRSRDAKYHRDVAPSR